MSLCVIHCLSNGAAWSHIVQCLYSESVPWLQARTLENELDVKLGNLAKMSGKLGREVDESAQRRGAAVQHIVDAHTAVRAAPSDPTRDTVGETATV